MNIKKRNYKQKNIMKILNYLKSKKNEGSKNYLNISLKKKMQLYPKHKTEQKV